MTIQTVSFVAFIFISKVFSEHGLQIRQDLMAEYIEWIKINFESLDFNLEVGEIEQLEIVRS